MSKQEVATLACRILGIYALLNALGALSFVGWGLMALGSPGNADTNTHLLAVGSLLASSLLPSVLYAAAGAFLWVKANWLACRMSSGIVTDTGTKIGGRDILVIAIPIVGLFVLAQAVPHVCEALSGLWLQARGAQLGTGVVPDAAGRMASQWATAAVQVALGLWLLLGSQGISEFLQARQAKTIARLSDRGSI